MNSKDFSKALDAYLENRRSSYQACLRSQATLKDAEKGVSSKSKVELLGRYMTDLNKGKSAHAKTLP